MTWRRNNVNDFIRKNLIKDISIYSGYATGIIWNNDDLFYRRIHASLALNMLTLIARFLGPTWGPSGADRTQVGPMLAP